LLPPEKLSLQVWATDTWLDYFLIPEVSLINPHEEQIQMQSLLREAEVAN
jgi:hypothetical protein